MLYRETSADVFTPWSGEPINGIVYPSSIARKWAPADLAALSLYAPIRPEVPEGKRIVSETVQRVQGVVQFVHELGDLPQDELYPPLEPWRFWSIVELSGITEAGLRAAVDNMSDASERTLAKAKLNNPPGGSFTRSDPLFANQELLAALNIDAAGIDSLWTQAHGLSG
jgi:hypothetical protein